MIILAGIHGVHIRMVIDEMETVGMELLIIKSGKDYIKVAPEGYTTCLIDKVSVFPMNNLEMVKEHVKRLKDVGFPRVAIHRLRILEEKFEG